MNAIKNRIALLVFLVILVGLPLVPATPEFWLTELNYIGLAALVAMGLMLLTGVAGLTSFGQAAFVGLGAYTTAYLTTQYGVSPWLGLVAGLVLTGVVAWFLGLITLRLSGHYLPLGTIAWGLSLYYLFGNIQALGEHNGIPGIVPISFFGISLLKGRYMFFLIWACVLLAAWASSNLLDSRPGRAIRALKNGAHMAESMGVNTASYKIVIFVWAALLAGLSGWLYAHMERTVSPSPFSLSVGIEYLFMVVVGGSSSVWGALLGAAFILVVKDQLQNLLPLVLHSQSNFELIGFGILMILMLQYASNGLWPLVSAWWARLGNGGQRRGGAAPAQAPALPHRARPQAGEQVLEVVGLRKEFGGLVAVNDISFNMRAGEIMGLIGPNGAGKSTTFNLVSGVIPATRGEVRFLGESIGGLPARSIATRGVGRTFQHVQLLPTMSVLENVALGAHLRNHVGVLAGALHADRAREAQLLHEAAIQLKRVGLGDYLYEQAGNLALGQQRILEIARALACDPVLLLLDEPAAGLRYKEKQELAQVLEQLRDEGLSILLVEHDMDFVMRLTNHLVVMDFGTKLAEGPPAEIRENPVVLQAYLGGIDEDLPESTRSAEVQG